LVIIIASTVPVIQIGLTSDTLSEQQLFDSATILSARSSPPCRRCTPSLRGKQRVVSVDINPTSSS